MDYFFRIPDIFHCLDNNVFYFAPTSQWLIDILTRFLAVVNSSVNFLIYCIMSSQFRKHFPRVTFFLKLAPMSLPSDKHWQKKVLQRKVLNNLRHEDYLILRIQLSQESTTSSYTSGTIQKNNLNCKACEIISKKSGRIILIFQC